MTTFTDALTGTAGELLSARSGWTLTGAECAIQINSGGTAEHIPNGVGAPGFYTPTVQPSTANQFVQTALPVALATPRPMGVRLTAANGTGYLAGRNSTTTIALSRRASTGTQTSLGSYTDTSANLTAATFRLEASGSAITVLMNGVAIIGPVTDGSFTSGSVGIYSRDSGTVAPSQSQLRSWSSGDLGTAYFFSASAAGLALTPGNASLRIASKFAASAAALAVTSGNASMKLARRFAASSASLALQTASATIRAARRFAAGAGAIALTAFNAVFDVTSPPAFETAPLERTIIIPAQDRSCSVPAQNRTLTIAAQDRLTVIQE